MPKLPWVKHTIARFFFYTIRDFDDDDLNEFSQWTTTDKSNFIHHTENVNEYVNIVVYCNRATTYLESALLHIEMSIKVPKKVKICDWQINCNISWWFCRKLRICDTRWSSLVPLEWFPVHSTPSCYLLSKEWWTEKYFLL